MDFVKNTPHLQVVQLVNGHVIARPDQAYTGSDYLWWNAEEALWIVLPATVVAGIYNKAGKVVKAADKLHDINKINEVNKARAAAKAANAAAAANDARKVKKCAKGVPSKATDTLTHIRNTGRGPTGYKGGKTFYNEGRNGGQVLPKTDRTGNPITYNEFDVNPFTKGVNRGTERVVIGSDGKAYFTGDHYGTFTEIK